MSYPPATVINVEPATMSTQNILQPSPSTTSAIVEQPNGVQDSESSRQISDTPDTIIHVVPATIPTLNAIPSSSPTTSTNVEQPNGVQGSEPARQDAPAQSTTVNSSEHPESSSNPTAQPQSSISGLAPSHQAVSASWNVGFSPSIGRSGNEISPMPQADTTAIALSPPPSAPRPYRRGNIMITILQYIFNMFRWPFTRGNNRVIPGNNGN